ncbi:MAG: DUF2470 domain-containing protein [Thiothrix sp.]|nr:DUF2470 domain-containing protein [Thiothrix sp.]
MKADGAFDPVQAVKTLLRTARTGALATLMPQTGDPYCSLVNVASDADGAPLLLISALALHTKNLKADSRASLMLDERASGDPLEGVRAMIGGRFVTDTGERARRRYLAAQPDAEGFAGFTDFAIWRMELTSIHLVAGFGRIVDLPPASVLVDLTGAEALLAAETDIIDHMNADHADTMALYASQLLKSEAAPGPWRCVGCDPEGMDLQAGRRALRLTFPERVGSPAALRNVLKHLAGLARNQS